MLLPHTMKCQRSRGFYPFLFVPNIMSMIFDCVHLPSCQKTQRWESGLTALSLTSAPAFQELNKRHRIAVGVMPQAETRGNLAWEGNVTIHHTDMSQVSFPLQMPPGCLTESPTMDTHRMNPTTAGKIQSDCWIQIAFLSFCWILSEKGLALVLFFDR